MSLDRQGRGIGAGLLRDAISRTLLIAEQSQSNRRAIAEQVGIRALLTHPIDDEAVRFYTRFGFVVSPVRERQLLLLLKDARRWMR